MKYPITVTADGFAHRRPRAAASLNLSDAWRLVARNWGLLAALAITFIVHAPTLRYYFAGDDFVVVGSIRYSGTGQYLLDTLRMQDIVPSWRPLTGLVYAGEWHLFGMNAAGWRMVNLSFHLGSLAVMYTLVTRVTKRPAIGAISAVIFGVSGAHFDTVTYITALPHVMATFFVLASLLAVISYAQDGERNPLAFLLSFALFGAAFLANEGAFVYAPLVVVTYMLFARRWHRAPLRLVLHAAPFAALAAGWLSFYESCTCDQLKFDGYFWGAHVVPNYALYLSWLVYPAHHIPAHADPLRWALAGIVLVVAAFLAVRGPNLARVAVLGVALALLPFAPVKIWTASRYTYGAVAFFSPLAAITAYEVYDRVRRLHRYVRVPATVLGLAFVTAVAGLYGWQSLAQNSYSGRDTDRWQLLVNELRRTYPAVPPGTTIWIVDGPWTNPMEQYTWVPSVARAVYGDAAAFDLPRGAYASDPPRTENALFVQWTADGLRPVAPEYVTR
jgi:4-amino-4-deoxy-L-arabinose transferase-like glycosyltransferase